MSKLSLHVDILYRDNKTEKFKCSDYPAVSGDWITLYNDLERTSIPAQTITRIVCKVK